MSVRRFRASREWRLRLPSGLMVSRFAFPVASRIRTSREWRLRLHFASPCQWPRGFALAANGDFASQWPRGFALGANGGFASLCCAPPVSVPFSKIPTFLRKEGGDLRAHLAKMTYFWSKIKFIFLYPQCTLQDGSFDTPYSPIAKNSAFGWFSGNQNFATFPCRHGGFEDVLLEGPRATE